MIQQRHGAFRLFCDSGIVGRLGRLFGGRRIRGTACSAGLRVVSVSASASALAGGGGRGRGGRGHAGLALEAQVSGIPRLRNSFTASLTSLRADLYRRGDRSPLRVDLALEVGLEIGRSPCAARSAPYPGSGRSAGSLRGPKSSRASSRTRTSSAPPIEPNMRFCLQHVERRANVAAYFAPRGVSRSAAPRLLVVATSIRSYNYGHTSFSLKEPWMRSPPAVSCRSSLVLLLFGGILGGLLGDRVQADSRRGRRTSCGPSAGSWRWSRTSTSATAGLRGSRRERHRRAAARPSTRTATTSIARTSREMRDEQRGQVQRAGNPDHQARSRTSR